MPIIETDMIFAFLNTNDPHHKLASKLFTHIKSGYEVGLPTSVLIEMELIYKSNDREDDLASHVANLVAIPNITSLALTPKTILLSITLREEYNLSFFDSHHAATALENDGKIISTDQQFTKVSNLELIDPINYQK
ncbi:MAG: type II toxin-antitoxin system VapC family toxin [Promethearchaeota archaeon]